MMKMRGIIVGARSGIAAVGLLSSSASRRSFTVNFALLLLSSVYLVLMSTVLKWHLQPETTSIEVNLPHSFHDVNAARPTTSTNMHTTTTVGSDNNDQTKGISAQEIFRKKRSLPLTEQAPNSYLKPNVLEHLMSQMTNHSLVYWPGPWDGAGIVVEEFKLVFFTQGKVACTVFKQLFRRMMHLEDWMVHKEPHIPHNPARNGLTYLYHYKAMDALTILTSPDWTRAMFVRDPKERTLSAYLDKAAKKGGSYVRKHCCPGDQEEDEVDGAPCFERARHSFLGFLQVIQEQCCCDPHWGPQSTRIDPPAFRPYLSFVGRFDRIHEDTRRLLDHLERRRVETKTDVGSNKLHHAPSLWDQFGANGWGPFGNESIFSGGTQAKHQTSAVTKLRQYYNATVERFVEDLYQDDYQDDLLNFTPLTIF